MDGNEIMMALEELLKACTEIAESCNCSKCPCFHECINDTVVADFFENASVDKINSMLDLAYYGTHFTEDEYDPDADDADFRRKYEAEERMIDEEYGM